MHLTAVAARIAAIAFTSRPLDKHFAEGQVGPLGFECLAGWLSAMSRVMPDGSGRVPPVANPTILNLAFARARATTRSRRRNLRVERLAAARVDSAPSRAVACGIPPCHGA